MRTRDDCQAEGLELVCAEQKSHDDDEDVFFRMKRIFSVRFGSRIHFVDWYNTLKMGMGFYTKNCTGQRDFLRV